MDDGLTTGHSHALSSNNKSYNHKQNLKKLNPFHTTSKDMASLSMTTSLLPSSSSTLTRLPSRSTRRCVIVAKAASTAGQGENASLEMKQDGSNGRRDLIFAAAAAAVCSFVNVAMGEEEPARGTPEAKKKYAPICVTMPTARICRK